jgi:uncharacterized protein YjbJ (UPF0337 family)
VEVRWEQVDGIDVDLRPADEGSPNIDPMILKRLEMREGAGMNHDEIEGNARVIKGKVKQATGDLTDDPELHDEGVADEVGGEAQDTLGRVRRKVGDAVKEVGSAIKK